MSSKSSPFSELLKRGQAPEHTDEQSVTQAPAQPPPQLPEQPLSGVSTAAAVRLAEHPAAYGSRSKSSSPDHQRLTVYLRRETVQELNIRKAQTRRELSDLVQDALDAWMNSRSR